MKDIEIRMLENKNSYEIVGYALKFENESKDMGFYEIIDKNALNNTDMSECILTINHSEDKILARNNKNLSLEVDEFGLKFKAEVSLDTSYAKDLYYNMKNGLLNECSFRFSCVNDDWDLENENHYLRRVLNIDKLYDVSIVTTPAYEKTSALILERALKNKQANNKLISNKKEIELLKIKYKY